jgi:hypothetical protein
MNVQLAQVLQEIVKLVKLTEVEQDVHVIMDTSKKKLMELESVLLVVSDV